MEISVLCFLLATLSSFPNYEEEFQEFEGNYHEFYNDDLIGFHTNNEKILKFVHDFSEHKHPIYEKNGMRLYKFTNSPVEELPAVAFERYIRKGSTVVDYGAGQGICTLAFTSYVGLMGKCVAFEPSPENFKALYWNLNLNEIENAKLYCHRLNDKLQTLDALKLDNVSLIRINMVKDELPFLKGARQTISRCKPTLYLRIGMGYFDKYVQQAIHQQLDLIGQMGYRIESISQCEYLAIPQ